MEVNWTALLGKFEELDGKIIYKGGQRTYSMDPQSGPDVANILCNLTFGEGKIEADVSFEDASGLSGCEIILFYDTQNNNFLSAGLGGSGNMYSIRSFGENWTNLAGAGLKSNLKSGKIYHLEVELIGSHLTLIVDKIKVLSTNLRFNLPVTQVGLWCLSEKDINIENFKVKKEKPIAFIIMPFKSPFDELYKDVIKDICHEMNINPVRGDETYGPGLIIEDIINQIINSKLIIAEITDSNANVFYEVGYSHAMNKPTILLAEKGTKLPFDVNPFRTLFYENTISGKKRVEDSLRKHIEASLSSSVLSQ